MRAVFVPVCAVCDDGYTPGLGYSCSKCSDGRRCAAITLGAILVAAAVVTIARSIKFLGTDADLREAVEGFSDNDVGGDQRGRARAKASQAVKIIIVSWQIITQASILFWSTGNVVQRFSPASLAARRAKHRHFEEHSRGPGCA